MWRAVRLVVDTGITRFIGSRQSHCLLPRKCAESEQDIVNEVDRYIRARPALAYKIAS